MIDLWNTSSNRKRLLIGGCSFSEPKGYIDNNGEYYGHGAWIPWSDLLCREQQDSWIVKNTSKGSYGNGLIANKIIDTILRNEKTPDLVIVQWSAIGRAYSLNEKDFVKRVIEDAANGGIEFAPHMQEYISQNGREGWVTNVVDKISDSFYQTSFIHMIGLQLFLESRGIPYFTFWGWSQLDDELKERFKPYLDMLYNKNWFKSENSMSQYIQDKFIGGDGIMGNGDFHPSSKGQEYFYETVIKKELQKKRVI